MRFDYLFITTYLCGAQSCPCTFLSFKLHVLELSHNIVSVVFTYPWCSRVFSELKQKSNYCFDSLKSFKPVRLPFSLCSVMLKCVLQKLKRRYNNFRDVSLNRSYFWSDDWKYFLSLKTLQSQYSFVMWVPPSPILAISAMQQKQTP